MIIKTTQFVMRLSDTQKDTLRKLAEKSKLSMAEYAIRKLGLGK